MRLPILIVHITCGTLGLIVGPLAMAAPKRRGRHTNLGLVYQWLTAGLCLSALGLVLYRPEVWPLAIIATLTEAAALFGWWLERNRPFNWLQHHISFMCGSYVSFVTAFLVVNAQDQVWPWIVPTVVSTPWITRAAVRHHVSPAPAVAGDPSSM